MTDPRRMSLCGRAVAAVKRNPADSPHVLRNDALLAVAMMGVSTVLALLVRDGSRPDALGWTLLLCGQLPLIWRRRRPVAALVAMIAFIGPYHALEYTHTAAIPGSMAVLYTVAATGRPRRTVLVGVVVIGSMVAINLASASGGALDTLRIGGWIAAVLIAGANVRVYRRTVAETVERAETAERTREEEAARQVAEERLRIARDLHDLLAHSITLIGVQTSVASHILTVNPGRLDHAAIARALDDIAATCRTARAEVRTTLDVLRHGDAEDGPLPGLAALPDLARGMGARLTLRADEASGVPPAVEAAAYRIVQESLTNSARHAGPGAKAAVTVEARDGALHVTVTDDGSAAVVAASGSGSQPGSGDRPGAGHAPGFGHGPGFGLLGMRERARSVGGTLAAGPRDRGGFEVAAILPLPSRTVQEDLA